MKKKRSSDSFLVGLSATAVLFGVVAVLAFWSFIGFMIYLLVHWVTSQ